MMLKYIYFAYYKYLQILIKLKIIIIASSYFK